MDTPHVLVCEHRGEGWAGFLGITTCCWGHGMPLQCSSCSATVLGTDRGAEHVSGTFRGREAKWDAETWLLSEPLLFVPAQEGRALRNLLKQRLRGAAFKQHG